MEEIDVLGVLPRRVLGAGPQVGAGRFIKTSISPQVEHYYKGGDLCVTPILDKSCHNELVIFLSFEGTVGCLHLLESVLFL